MVCLKRFVCIGCIDHVGMLFDIQIFTFLNLENHLYKVLYKQIIKIIY